MTAIARRETLVATYPGAEACLPTGDLGSGRYVARFARTPEELERVLRLRYEVFNLELGEGLDEADITGRDEDRFDAAMHHLMIVEAASNSVVGTYRMQTARMARANLGFYSEGEYEIDAVPRSLLDRAVEVGRACVAREHRNGRVLHLLWRGLARYLAWNDKSALFGCCSLTTQDPRVGVAVYEHLAREGHLDRHIRVPVQPHVECDTGHQVLGLYPVPSLPALFQSYLNLGATVWSGPAIDREFKTIDFLVGLDVASLDDRTYRSFFR